MKFPKDGKFSLILLCQRRKDEIYGYFWVTEQSINYLLYEYKIHHTFSFCSLTFCSNVSAQKENEQMVRLAKLVIDSVQLSNYKAYLKEEIETSIRVEPGVLTLYAVAEKQTDTYNHSGNLCQC